MFCLLIVIFTLQMGSLNAFAIEDHDHSDLFKNVEIKDGSVLSVIDCVATAFKNSPKIKKQKYNLDLAKSNVGIAKSQFFPVINMGVGFYNENNSNKNFYDTHYRELPKVGVSVNQLVYNFGKTTSYIKMEEFYKIGAEYEFMDSLCHTLFDVKLKYYALLRAKALEQIAKTDVEINESFVKLAQNRKKEDLTTAKVNLSHAKVKHLTANNNLKNAKIDLNNSMYLDSQPNYSVESTHTFTYSGEYSYNKNLTANDIFEPENFTFPMDKAVEIAYANSPDLKVLENTKYAMEQSLKYIKRMYLPDLTANVGYGFNNTNTQSTNNGLQVGVNLSSNINLMELKHSIKGADAQLNLADNEIELFKKDLYFEVKRAFNNVEEAQNQIPVTKFAIGEAIENLNLIESSYKSNQIDYTSLQDARKDYINALTNYVEALYNYNIALIQVEEAMHYHIVDIHHKSDHAVHYHSEELIKHLNEALGCDEKEVKHLTKKKHSTH